MTFIGGSEVHVQVGEGRGLAESNPGANMKLLDHTFRRRNLSTLNRFISCMNNNPPQKKSDNDINMYYFNVTIKKY